ncbi:DUF4270 domain-containing protein [Marinirhabdus gelatinilytica]|uniref:Uncharacterized protein DUF4270 n=1 Tax=Marinirhabdus gelatinilytica TaxID=1703343 RepID=A0A370QKB5_9FLAO|nr:DUF4270 domain-containing protein [Marinirhabdus gelatinilytica]RDK88771.1 uncharacterized protein DUF4270 [Marinirhabdus gelatinilytica]
MKIKNLLPKFMAILIVIVVFASCEEDFNTIGSDIVDQNFDTELYDEGNVLAYSRKLLPVQTSDLPSYQLGTYTDPVYGKSTVNLLSQVTLANTDPDFGDCTQLDSVVLYIPYFTEEETDSDGVTSYTLDSVYGNEPISISIYESGFFLRDLDPEANFEELQKYYSNQGQTFDNFQGELIATIEDFVPSGEAIVLNDTTSLEPGLRVHLPVDFFQEKIFDMEGSAELINNNNFREYFRGLYFKVENVTGDGNLFSFDLSDGDNDITDDARINMYYTFKALVNQTCEENTDDPIETTALLNFNGVSVNTFQNELNPDVASAIANPNINEGEENLYVRGGDGIISVVELFGEDLDGNGVADQLEFLRDQEWLINEANLIFYVNQDIVTGGDAEPDRIIIYDLGNDAFLADLSVDPTSSNEPFEALVDHWAPLERGSDGNGEFYKLRITNHINNLINRDSTNVPLGVVVSQNVTEFDFQDLENSQAPGIDNVPASSILSHRGTVLYGNNTTNEGKRLKLQIFYTEPN